MSCVKLSLSAHSVSVVYSHKQTFLLQHKQDINLDNMTRLFIFNKKEKMSFIWIFLNKC